MQSAIHIEFGCKPTMKNTYIFAHRGANKEAPENTRSAFDKALAYPIDGMETDIQLTRDEVCVLWHDRFLNKVGLPDKYIDDYDYAQLREMNVGAHFSSEKPFESVMNLNEFLDAYRTRCQLLLEIKNREWESPERHQIKVRQTLDRVGVTHDDRILVSSFNLTSLIYGHQYRPDALLVYNFEDDQTIDDAKRVLDEQPYLHGLCLPISSLNQAMVEFLGDQRKCIAVYTCNSDQEINLALELGVNILISDIPQRALQLKELR